jgi:diguanylate cyclase (GGDEF)-like protein
VRRIGSEHTDAVGVVAVVGWLVATGVGLWALRLRRRLAGARSEVSERKHLEDRLAHQATHDDLTGLANRASLVAELDRAANRAERSGQGVGLLFIDLDRFKAVNDTLGHRIGDVVLQRVAHRLHQATRDTDLVARIGGDEFVVLAEEAPDVAVVARLAERIQSALSAPVAVGDDEVPVSASIGVAWLEPGEHHALDQLRDADVAMYHAKSIGPGHIRIFDDDLRQAVEQRFDLERELRRAVGAGALDAGIQPIIDLRTGQVVGGELLCRWTTEDGREVPPEAFIEVAEDSTLVVEIGRWMLARAGRLLHEWALDVRPGGLADLRLSVNLSGRHIDHPGVVDDVTSLWRHGRGIDPSKLVIEITETSLLRDLGEAARTLDQLRQAGVSICVDDFGVGHASLRYLRELPVALVKIDRSIVAGFGRDDSDTVIVTMLARLADVLEIEIVAEGLETEDQREELAELGCHYAQGYLFARAMPPEVFPAWYARWRRQHTHPSAWRTVAAGGPQAIR